MVYPTLARECEECKSKRTTQVINAENKIRKGWLCEDCGHFTLAKNRERLLDEIKSK